MLPANTLKVESDKSGVMVEKRMGIRGREKIKKEKRKYRVRK